MTAARKIQTAERAKSLSDADIKIAQERSYPFLPPDDPHFCGLCATRNQDGICRTPWCRNGGAK